MRAGKPEGINNPNHVASGRVRKTYSISVRLTISLIIVVVLVSLFPISWIYINRTRQAKSTLENRADETFDYLSHILATPLWTVDEDTVTAIGDTLSRDEMIVQLAIMNSSNKMLYSLEKELGSTLITRKGNIYFQDHFVGNVTLAFTTQFLQKNSRDLMQSFAITTIVILVSLVVVTGLFVRIFLRKPINSLNNIIHSYTEGDYDSPVTALRYREFQPFRQVLIQMGQTIKAQLNELEKAEEKYRSIFENAVEGILQITSKGRIINANPSLAYILDYGSSKELVRSITDIGQQLFADPSRWTELLRRFKDRDIVSNFEIQLYNKNGNLQWISLNARALRNAEGKLRSLEGFLTDITASKRLEEQLQIRQRMDSLGTLAGGIAHDFNNLLTVIMGYIDMLNLHSENFTETQKKYLSNAVKSSQRAADLISQLQTLSRGVVTKKASVDVYEAVAEVFRMLEKTTDRLIKKEVKMKPGEYYVTADPSELNQVFLNLGTNAVQSIEEKGTKPGDYIIVSAEECEVSGVDVKVIICSGQSDENIREGILSKTGGYLKKPYRVNDLARTVREVLDS